MSNRITAADLKDSTAAINFALDHLQDWETTEFLKEWRQGKDLTPWIGAWEHDQGDEGNEPTS